MTDSISSRKPRKSAKNRPRLRDGVMKRGSTRSYVIRVPDPETGVSKPKWVGGFPTEEAVKQARDEGRVKARRGEYIDRNTITVAEYLDQWLARRSGDHLRRTDERRRVDAAVSKPVSERPPSMIGRGLRAGSRRGDLNP